MGPRLNPKCSGGRGLEQVEAVSEAEIIEVFKMCNGLSSVKA